MPRSVHGLRLALALQGAMSGACHCRRYGTDSLAALYAVVTVLGVAYTPHLITVFALTVFALTEPRCPRHGSPRRWRSARAPSSADRPSPWRSAAGRDPGTTAAFATASAAPPLACVIGVTAPATTYAPHVGTIIGTTTTPPPARVAGEGGR